MQHPSEAGMSSHMWWKVPEPVGGPVPAVLSSFVPPLAHSVKSMQDLAFPVSAVRGWENVLEPFGGCGRAEAQEGLSEDAT